MALMVASTILTADNFTMVAYFVVTHVLDASAIDVSDAFREHRLCPPYLS